MTITVRQISRAAFGIGVLFAIAGAFQWWDGERTFARMRPTICTVLTRTIEANLLVSPPRNSMGPGTARIREEAHLVLDHTVDGRQYRFSEEFVRDWSQFAKAGYEEGKTYPCRYDPQDPSRGTIRDEFDSTGPMGTLVLGCAVILLALAAPTLWP